MADRKNAKAKDDEDKAEAASAKGGASPSDDYVKDRGEDSGNRAAAADAEHIGEGKGGNVLDRDLPALPEELHPEANTELASTTDELDEIADQVAQSVVASIAPARAREEAKAARVRAGASDFQQSLIEARLADLLDDVAERHERVGAAVAERARLNQGRVAQLGRAGGIASGPLGRPLPKALVRGEPVVVHQPEGTLDQFGFITRLWPEVNDNPDDPKSAKRRWRADVVTFPLNSGSTAHAEGLSYGSGIGQFELVKELDEDDADAVARRDHHDQPWRHEIR